jgi:hypothetical protein
MALAATSFNSAEYSRVPVFDTPHGVALTISLLNALEPVLRLIPASITVRLRSKAASLRARALELQSAWQKRPVQGGDPARVLADHRLDVAWGALFDRLASAAALGATRYDLAARAEQLMMDLFEDQGLAFLNFDFALEEAESTRRLARIDRQNLGPDIEALAGAEFLTELRESHQGYSEVLHPQLTEVKVEPPELQGPRRALATAMREYVHQLVGLADEREFPGSVAAVQTAIGPIVQYRQRLARVAREKKAGGAAGPADGAMPPPDVTPATPIPEVPAHG